MTPDAALMKDLEKKLKELGWKKLAGAYVINVNEDTLAHFNVFRKDADTLRVQMHTTSKLLNRVSWRIFGLPEAFGTLKDHLINSSKCQITSAYFARDGDRYFSDVRAQAEAIAQDCRTRSERFDAVDKIVLECEAIARMEPTIDRSVELICGYIAQSDFAKAMNLVEQKKRSGFPGYGISFFAHAEKFLRARI